jgi:hypothetical protein
MNLRTISDQDWAICCAMSDAVDCDGFSVEAFKASLAEHGLAVVQTKTEAEAIADLKSQLGPAQ